MARTSPSERSRCGPRNTSASALRLELCRQVRLARSSAVLRPPHSVWFAPPAAVLPHRRQRRPILGAHGLDADVRRPSSASRPPGMAEALSSPSSRMQHRRATWVLARVILTMDTEGGGIRGRSRVKTHPLPGRFRTWICAPARLGSLEAYAEPQSHSAAIRSSLLERPEQVLGLSPAGGRRTRPRLRK